MRTIKFRGKWVSYGKWVYGSLLCSQDETTTAIQTSKFTYRVDPKTVGQFTGLHDISGTEIYEGDIVMVGNNTLAYEISWYNSSAAYCLMRNGVMNIELFPIFYPNPKLIRLIGNIHDNPELLKKIE
jgi:uncharacterized phage protein (TIGR01671 family)